MAIHGNIIVEGARGVTEYHGFTFASVLAEMNEPDAKTWLDGEYQGTLIEAIENDGQSIYKCDGCGRYFQVGDTYLNASGEEYCYDYCLDKQDKE